MKNLLLISSLLCSVVVFAQKETVVKYKGKVGLSTIEFQHRPFPLGSTATITTGKSSELYNNCAEDPNSKVHKLCWYSEKDGYNYKKNIKVNLNSAAKKTPGTVTGTYTINGEPVKFKLTRL